MDKRHVALAAISGARVTAFSTLYVDVAGGHLGGLLLSQIIYWHKPGKSGRPKLRVKRKGELWLAKARTDWWDEIRITEWEYDTAIKVLKQKGIVEVRNFHFGGKKTPHIRLLWDGLADRIVEVLEEQGLYEEYFGEVDVESSENGEYIGPDQDANTETTIKDNNNKGHQDTLQQKCSTEGCGEKVSEHDPKGSKCRICLNLCSTEGCGRKVTEDDPRGERCKYCWVRAAWRYHMVEGPKKRGKPMPSSDKNAASNKKIDAKIDDRWKEEGFRHDFIVALERMSLSGKLSDKKTNWSKLYFFLGVGKDGESNWRKILEGFYDFLDEQEYPADYRAIQAWESGKQLPTASFSPMGG